MRLRVFFKRKIFSVLCLLCDSVPKIKLIFVKIFDKFF